MENNNQISKNKKEYMAPKVKQMAELAATS